MFLVRCEKWWYWRVSTYSLMSICSPGRVRRRDTQTDTDLVDTSCIHIVIVWLDYESLLIQAGKKTQSHSGLGSCHHVERDLQEYLSSISIHAFVMWMICNGIMMIMLSNMRIILEKFRPLFFFFFLFLFFVFFLCVWRGDVLKPPQKELGRLGVLGRHLKRIWTISCTMPPGASLLSNH